MPTDDSTTASNANTPSSTNNNRCCASDAATIVECVVTPVSGNVASSPDEDAARGGFKGRRIAGRLHHHLHEGPATLLHRAIELDFRGCRQRLRAHVLDDADHFHDLAAALRAHDDAASEQSLVAAKFSRSGLRHDRHERRFSGVALGEITSGEHRDLQRREVSGRHRHRQAERPFIERRHRALRQRVRRARESTVQRRRRAQRCAFDTRCVGELVREPQPEAALRIEIGIAGGWDADTGHEDAAVIVTGGLAAQLRKTRDEQARADQQHQRDRHLRHHDRAARAVAAERAGNGASAISQHRDNVGPRSLHAPDRDPLPRRRQAPATRLPPAPER